MPNSQVQKRSPQEWARHIRKLEVRAVHELQELEALITSCGGSAAAAPGRATRPSRGSLAQRCAEAQVAAVEAVQLLAVRVADEAARVSECRRALADARRGATERRQVRQTEAAAYREQAARQLQEHRRAELQAAAECEDALRIEEREFRREEAELLQQAELVEAELSAAVEAHRTELREARSGEARVCRARALSGRFVRAAERTRDGLEARLARAEREIEEALRAEASAREQSLAAAAASLAEQRVEAVREAGLLFDSLARPHGEALGALLRECAAAREAAGAEQRAFDESERLLADTEARAAATARLLPVLRQEAATLAGAREELRQQRAAALVEESELDAEKTELAELLAALGRIVTERDDVHERLEQATAAVARSREQVEQALAGRVVGLLGSLPAGHSEPARPAAQAAANASAGHGPAPGSDQQDIYSPRNRSPDQEADVEQQQQEEEDHEDVGDDEWDERKSDDGEQWQEYADEEFEVEEQDA